MSFSLLIKLAVAAASLPALWLLVPRDPAAAPAPWRRPAAISILLGVRLAAAGVWAFFPSLVGSPDLALYYVPQGRKLLAGLVPGVDFESSYSPLFTLLTAGALAVFDRPVSVFLVIVAFELAGLWCLDRMLRGDGTAPGLRDAALAAYAVHPLALWYSGVTAYQSTMIMAFFAAALAAFARPWASAALVAFALPFTKLLAVLAWPAPALRRRGTLAALGCFTAALALVAGLAAAGIDPRAALYRESLDTPTATSGSCSGRWPESRSTAPRWPGWHRPRSWRRWGPRWRPPPGAAARCCRWRTPATRRRPSRWSAACS